MNEIIFPDDFSTETVDGHNASGWTNAQVLKALNETVDILAGEAGIPDTTAGKNYRCIANEIRRRMQANIENFVRLELEMFYPVDKETGQIEDEKDIPEKLDSVETAEAALEFLADEEDDMVHVGVTTEDYMRTWNRMIERKKKKIFYYDDENDEEHLRIDTP